MGFLSAICQIGIFMLCAQAIVHFRPKASYEKYLKMLVSPMILLQLFLAVGGIFSTEGKIKMEERLEEFTKSLNEGMKQAADSAFLSEEALQFQILGEDPEGVQQKETEEHGEIMVQLAPISPIRVESISQMD